MTVVAAIMGECACINSSTFILGVSNIYIVIFKSDSIYLTLHQRHAVYAPIDTHSMNQTEN